MSNSPPYISADFVVYIRNVTIGKYKLLDTLYLIRLTNVEVRLVLHNNYTKSAISDPIVMIIQQI